MTTREVELFAGIFNKHNLEDNKRGVITIWVITVGSKL